MWYEKRPENFTGFVWLAAFPTQCLSNCCTTETEDVPSSANCDSRKKDGHEECPSSKSQ